MRVILKRLAKMMTGYGAVQWAGPFLSFIFTPIITRILTPSDYGVADFVLTVASAVGTVALFALPQALTAHFNDQTTDDWKRHIIGSALAASWIIGIPIGLALIVFAPQVAQSTFGNPSYIPLFRLVGATVAFGVCSTVLTTAAQAWLRVRWGMLLSATAILMTVLGNVLYIIVLRLGATGMVLTAVTTGVTTGLVALVMMRHTVGSPSKAIMGILFRSGGLLFPTMISAWALQVIDRFFLVQYVTTASLGHYAIANKIASLLYVAMAPLYLAWTPLALSMQHDDPIVRQRYAIMARYIIGAVLAAALGLGLFATEILIVFTRTPYLPAAPYVGFLAYVHVFSGISTVLYTSALAGKQLKAISTTTIAGAVVNVLLNFILIPPYGVWGATVATVIGYAVPTISLYLLLRTRFPVPYPVWRVAGALGAQFILLGIGLFVPPIGLVLRVTIKLIIFVLLPLSFVLLGVITPYEIRQLGVVAGNTLRVRLSHR